MDNTLSSDQVYGILMANQRLLHALLRSVKPEQLWLVRHLYEQDMDQSSEALLGSSYSEEAAEAFREAGDAQSRMLDSLVHEHAAVATHDRQIV